MKQIIITLIAWTTIVLSVSATGQEGEQLFWKGANYQMLTCPLYDCHEFDNLGKKLEEEWSSTSLWRGYVVPIRSEFCHREINSAQTLCKTDSFSLKTSAKYF